MSAIKKVVLVFFVSGIHFLLTLLCISKASVQGDDGPETFWLRALDVVAFPVLYLQKVEYRWGTLRAFGFDLIPLLVICNSILWGIAIVATVLLIGRLLARRNDNRSQNVR